MEAAIALEAHVHAMLDNTSAVARTPVRGFDFFMQFSATDVGGISQASFSVASLKLYFGHEFDELLPLFGSVTRCNGTLDTCLCVIFKSRIFDLARPT